MSEKERGFRDDHGAAVERAARLQEENDRLRAELDEARKAKTDSPPAPRAEPKAPPPPPPGRVGLGIALVGALLGGSIAIGVSHRASPVRPPPSFTIPPIVFSAPPMPSFTFERMPMPAILMHGVSTASRPVARPHEKLVEVRSHPRGATITLGGRPVGVTPNYVRFKPDSCTDNICRATLTFEGREAAVELTPDTVGVVGHDFTIKQTETPPAQTPAP